MRKFEWLFNLRNWTVGINWGKADVINTWFFVFHIGPVGFIYSKDGV